MPDHVRWEDFARLNNLNFRTACNEAAPNAERPLRWTVLDRIASDADGRKLLDEYDSSESPEPLLAWLGKEPRWRTIVDECIAANRREIEGFKSIRDFVQRTWAWLNKKPADGSPAPMDKIATAAVTGLTATLGIGAGVVVTVKWALPDTLSIPVSLKAAGNDSPITLNLTADGPKGTLPISFTLEPVGKDAQIPIQLTSGPQNLSFQLSANDTAALGRMSDAIADAVAALKRLNDAGPVLSKDIAAQGAVIRQAIADIKIQPGPSEVYVKTLADGLNRIAISLSAEDQSSSLKSLTEQLKLTSTAIARLRGLAATGRTLTTMAAPENQPTIAHVDWPKDDGTIAHCDLQVTIGKIARTVDVQKVHVQCDGRGAWDAPLEPSAKQAHAGDALWFKDHEFALAVDAIQRPYFASNFAVLRVVSAPERPRPADNGQRPAAGTPEK